MSTTFTRILRSGIIAGFLVPSLHKAVVAAPSPSKTRRRPNIVFVLADDLGYGDVKCFGGKRCRIRTPNFDRLAADGMRFTDAHAIASVCVPSRIGIMTGRYAWRFRGPRFRAPWGFLGPVLPDGQFTLGTMLRSAGYRTGYVGKWHLGTLMQTRDGKTQGPNNVDYAKPLKIGPPQFGFDASFILPGSLDMYPYAFVRNNRWVGQVTARKGWSAFHRVGPAAEDFEDAKVLDTLCSEAERFISTNAANARSGKPFFLYLALTSPHTPISPSSAFVGKSLIGLYGDFVMETDHCVGRVMRALKKHGLDRNTLFIATSDHGAAAYAGRKRKATFGQMIELEKEGHYSRGPFRGYKFSAYEGGFRVPFVARWPGVVRTRTRCDALIGLNDLMATLADLTGAKLNPAHAPDSSSFLPLLKDPHAKPQRKTLALHSTQAFAFRSGQWKLLLCPGSGCAGRFGNVPPSAKAWKDAVRRFGRAPRTPEEFESAPFVQLYNLAIDVSESKNQAGKRADKVREMIQLLRRQIANGRSTAGPRLSNDVSQIDITRK
jgi:arylsulfatase A